ncbi:MAG: alpha/beta fold hydrolase [Acidimicrobiia bacterium]
MTTRRIAVAGGELALVDEGDGFPVLLVHGFPELAFSWRHQIPALTAAGYRILAPDMRGYGASLRPEAIEDYDITHLSDDLVAILDDIGAPQAVVVGHDWGSMIAWQFALLHPDRTAAVVGMSVPFVPRPAMPPVAMMRQLFADNFFYIVYFQEPGVADAELGRDPATTLRRLLCAAQVDPQAPLDPSTFAADGRGFVERMPEPGSLPDWLSADELAVFVDAFTRTGFTGAINWYRNLDRNWELTAGVADAHVTMPSLFVAGAQDPVLMMTPPQVSAGWLDDHRGDVLVEDAGHWEAQQQPAAVNAAIVGFLDSLDLPGRT